MRAIDADALKEDLTRFYDNEVTARKLIDEQPTIQPELGTNLAEVGTDCCISRQAVFDALRTCYDTETITMDNGDEYINYGDAVGEIEQLPPIQPKRGRWHYSDGKPARIGSFGVVCDQCDTESEYCTNFCGECGADMRGEQDG